MTVVVTECARVWGCSGFCPYRDFKSINCSRTVTSWMESCGAQGTANNCSCVLISPQGSPGEVQPQAPASAPGLSVHVPWAGLTPPPGAQLWPLSCEPGSPGTDQPQDSDCRNQDRCLTSPAVHTGRATGVRAGVGYTWSTLDESISPPDMS